MTVVPFRTPVAAATNPFGRFTLPSGKVVTVLPLVDSSVPAYGAGPIAARLDREEAIAALAAIRAHLPSRETVLEIAKVGFWVPPMTMVRTAEDQRLMRTEDYCRRHDAEMFRRLAAAGWDGRTVVSTFGKWHVAGAAPGANRICGWPRSKGGQLIQAGLADVHIGESLTDYATLTIGEFDDADTAEPPPLRSTIRLGSRGPDVTAWQSRIGAGTDGVFGPMTDALTRAWQSAHGLVADGVVGAKSWATVGEEWSAGKRTMTRDPRSPAAVAAIRDANARWPGRQKASDGIMGDARHQRGKSGHNTGDAFDVTHDPASGCDGYNLAAMALRDERTQYVIFAGRIYNIDIDREPPLSRWSATTGRKYTGSNSHHHHVHVEVIPEMREDASPWPWAP